MVAFAMHHPSFAVVSLLIPCLVASGCSEGSSAGDQNPTPAQDGGPGGSGGTTQDAATEDSPHPSEEAAADSAYDTAPADDAAESGSDEDAQLPTDAGDLGPCGRPWDHTVDSPYALEGTWMFGRKKACDWQDVLEKFHRAGGGWIWQFGPELKPRTQQELEADAAFSGCTVAGKSCIQDAIDDIGASRIQGLLSYSFGQSYSSAIAQCPSLDKQVSIGSSTWHRIVLPTSSSQGSCPASGKVFVVFAASDDVDSEQLLLEGADTLGMKVIVGMPGIAHSTVQAWDVEPTLLAATREWSRRVFADYQQRAQAHPSFAGTYQTFEVPLTGSGLDAAYSMYGELAQLFHSMLPGKLFALSPYWAANKLHGDTKPSDVSAGIARLAKLDIDIIAPQDGRGTSKGALYWPYEADKPIAQIDPQLAKASTVPAGATFAETYNASTRELYAAARQAADAAGGHVQLWANFEAFEPTAEEACSYASEGRTTKPRLDRAITMGAGYAHHVVSYMYDPLFTCTTSSHPKALIDEILEDAFRPIIDTAFQFSSGGQDGFIVRGYHIAEKNPKFTMTWYDPAWTVHSHDVTPSWTDPAWGETNGGRRYAQEVFVPFPLVNLAPSFWVHLRAKNDAGQASESFSYAY